MSLADYQRMQEEQNYRCAICGDTSYTLHVDHDHSTGKVRGLLCSRCNKGLGHFKDNRDIISGALHYLQEYGS